MFSVEVGIRSAFLQCVSFSMKLGGEKNVKRRIREGRGGSRWIEKMRGGGISLLNFEAF